ncbi:AsnC family protein [Streptomyces sp. NPDC002888]|uniref:AsnC family protein n=1 Tax=Streptomyces sp. NPDC002888 TaxID=3364668 RepID=UPI00369F60AC
MYDRIDRAILDHLQRHGRTPNVDLAEAVRLSPRPACAAPRRWRRTASWPATGPIWTASALASG